MKVTIQYFAKGQFNEDLFSVVERFATNPEELTELLRKGTSKKVNGTCFVYVNETMHEAEYYRVMRESDKIVVTEHKTSQGREIYQSEEKALKTIAAVVKFIENEIKSRGVV